MIAPYGHVLVLGTILFLLGSVCALARRNLIMILIGVEIMMNAAGIVLVGASLKWGQLDGQVFVLFLLTVAAAEVAVGLALVLHAQRRTGTVDADRHTLMKG